jgi:hypothetical protein
MMRYRCSRSAVRTPAPVRSCAASTRARENTRYISAISADAEGHLSANLRGLSQIELDTGPEAARSDWVDAR